MHKMKNSKLFQVSFLEKIGKTHKIISRFWDKELSSFI